MEYTYVVGNGLYINLTNKCGNDCDFCVRQNHDTVGQSGSLWLDEEPSREEVWNELKRHDVVKFDEIVFCGFGEPTERLDDLLWIAARIKKHYPTMRVRLNTNGQASLIAGRDVSGEIAGLIDCVSVSLNYATEQEYIQHCRPVYGEDAYGGLLDFAKKLKNHNVNVILSVVEGTTDVAKAQQVADDAGLPLRVREYIL